MRYTKTVKHINIRRPKRATLIASTGLLCAVVIVGWLASSPKNTPVKQAPKLSPAPTHVVTHSTPTPSEKPVTSTTYHSTATGDQPAYIKLPTLQSEGYIQNVGIDQNGALAAPTDVQLAGWYVNSLSPGQAGLSIIDGHVDGIHAPGIFYHLNKLKVGDSIEVDLANGQAKTFAVQSVQQLPAATATTALFARNYQFASQLNLITCGGIWNNTTHLYADRIVVTAALQ